MSTFTPSNPCEPAKSISSSKCLVFPSSVMFFKLFMWCKVAILIEETKMSISDMRNLLAPGLQEPRLPPSGRKWRHYTFPPSTRSTPSKLRTKQIINVARLKALCALEIAEFAPPYTQNSGPPANKPPASMSSSARRLRREPFDERSARILCGVHLALPRLRSSVRLGMSPKRQLVTAHKTMSEDLDEKVGNCTFLHSSHVELECGTTPLVRDDSAWSHLMGAQLG